MAGLFSLARPPCPAFLARGRAPSVVRRASVEVRAASDNEQASAGPALRSLNVPATASLDALPSTQPAARNPGNPSVSPYRVTLWDALKFNGPAPEKINGRLAMLAIALAAQTEVETGASVLEQAQHPSWGVAAAMLLIIYGSMVPIQYGAIDEPLWIFTPAAEKWNGRLAMLGFAGLAGLEYYTGGLPFF